MKRRAIALAALGLIAWAPAAAAQDSKADAERLFREAQTLLEQRKYGEACPKFESSYKKDRQLGTLLNLAFCHKEEGRNWFAWLEFKEAELIASEGGRKERVQFARARLAELEKKLPRAKLSLNANVKLSQLLVEDRTVPDAERGAVFTVDPGERKFVFIAPGKKPVTKLVTITKTDRPTKIAVPDMEDAPDEPPPPPRDPEGPVATPPPPPPEGDKPAGGGSQRTLAWVSFGGAALAAGIGTVFGLRTFSAASDQKDVDARVCPAGDSGCENAKQAERSSLGSDGNRDGAIATAAFIGAGVFLGAGVVLLLTAEPREPARKGGLTVRPVIGPGFGSLVGTF